MHIQLSAMEKDKRLLGQHLEREERVLSDVENRCRGFAAILLAHHDKRRRWLAPAPASADDWRAIASRSSLHSPGHSSLEKCWCWRLYEYTGPSSLFLWF